jgi:hypothetical protein
MVVREDEAMLLSLFLRGVELEKVSLFMISSSRKCAFLARFLETVDGGVSIPLMVIFLFLDAGELLDRRLCAEDCGCGGGV